MSSKSSQVELMSVALLAGLFTLIVAPKLMSYVSQAETVTAQRELEVLKQAVTLYHFHVGVFPKNLDDLIENPQNISHWNGPYLEEHDLRDPWENHYGYRYPGIYSPDFELWSYGADHKHGGKGEYADIVSWKKRP